MTKIRITSGDLKNMSLEVSQDTRALSEVVKLAVFSMIGETIKDKTCLDLFAGSGNLGIEAISRGAAKSIFVDSSRHAISSIKNNVQKALTRQTSVNEANFEIIQKDVLDVISNAETTYDIIFMDPPYGTPNRFLLKQITNVMNSDSQLFYFHKNTEKYTYQEINSQLKLIESKSYGITTVDLLALI